MTVRVRAADGHVLNLRTRMPFRYGIAAMTAVPHLFLSVDLAVGGQVARGVAADNLPPKWFTKAPATPFRDDLADMLAVIGHAAALAGEIGDAPTVFDLWHQLYAAQGAWAAGRGHPPLLWGFGVSLVERAAIDAFCRATGTPFAAAIRADALGVRLGDLYPELAGLTPADLLPARPLDSVVARHTVGLADPLTDAEIPAAERLDDGLPQALDAAIRAYGLTHFKIKVGGDGDQDRERLRRLARLLDAAAGDYAFTLDGNEGYRAVAPFRAFWASLAADPTLAPFLRRLLFVEQPFHRDVALGAETGRDLAAWPDRPPIVIDESDGRLGDLATALERGYAGASHKGCKGIFKGLANACLLAARRRADPDGCYLLSAEDLSTVGPVALLQDLAVVATLGVPHAERNGHHYFAGLRALPPDLQGAVLARHGDLYRRHPGGYPTLDLRAGRVSTASVVAAPFGVGFDLDPTRFTPLADWRYETLDGAG